MDYRIFVLDSFLVREITIFTTLIHLWCKVQRRESKAVARLFCGRAAPDKQKNAEKITFLHFFCISLAILTGFSSMLQ